MDDLELREVLETAVAEALPRLDLMAVAVGLEGAIPVDAAGQPVRVEGVDNAANVNPMRWPDGGLLIEVSDGSRWLLTVEPISDPQR